jgi:hypothetical protein
MEGGFRSFHACVADGPQLLETWKLLVPTRFAGNETPSTSSCSSHRGVLCVQELMHTCYWHDGWLCAVPD